VADRSPPRRLADAVMGRHSSVRYAVLFSDLYSFFLLTITTYYVGVQFLMTSVFACVAGYPVDTSGYWPQTWTPCRLFLGYNFVLFIAML